MESGIFIYPHPFQFHEAMPIMAGGKEGSIPDLSLNA